MLIAGIYEKFLIETRTNAQKNLNCRKVLEIAARVKNSTVTILRWIFYGCSSQAIK